MNKRKEQGFTIIEVVLVLAIAGLIFLMVFLALPALQRGQRDTQRRNSLSTFSAQISQYQANNKGNVPSTGAATATCATAPTSDQCFVTKYMQSNWTDPQSNAAFVRAASDSAVDTATVAGTYFYSAGSVCNGESITAGGGRNFAVRMKLEGAGVACQDNK